MERFFSYNPELHSILNGFRIKILSLVRFHPMLKNVSEMCNIIDRQQVGWAYLPNKNFWVQILVCSVHFNARNFQITYFCLFIRFRFYLYLSQILTNLKAFLRTFKLPKPDILDILTQPISNLYKLAKAGPLRTFALAMTRITSDQTTQKIYNNLWELNLYILFMAQQHYL